MEKIVNSDTPATSAHPPVCNCDTAFRHREGGETVPLPQPVLIRLLPVRRAALIHQWLRTHNTLLTMAKEMTTTEPNNMLLCH